MASYVFQFDSTSSDLNDWQAVTVDPTGGAYTNASAGHASLDISVQTNGLYTPMETPVVTIGLAWVDCDSNKNNAVLGVTKYETKDISCGMMRKSDLDNSGGNFAYCANTPFRITGVGPCVDLRTTPANGITRVLLVGVVSLVDAIGPITVIVTPTKIV
jgi:hypothetical protein